MSVGGSRVSGGDAGEGKTAGPAQLAAENESESAVCRRGDAVSPSGLSGRGMGCLRRVQYLCFADADGRPPLPSQATFLPSA